MTTNMTIRRPPDAKYLPNSVGAFFKIGTQPFVAPAFADTIVAGWCIDNGRVKVRGTYDIKEWSVYEVHRYLVMHRRWRRFGRLPLALKRLLRVPLEKPVPRHVVIYGNQVNNPDIGIDLAP